MALYVAIDAEFTISETDEPIWTIWNGFSPPIIRGPKIEPPPSFCNNLKEIFADNRLGIINTLAGPESLQNG